MKKEPKTILSKQHLWLAISLLAITFFIGLAYFTGQIPDFFLGEEYDKIRFPALNNHLDSWTGYFQEKGRPVEGIYWTYMYEVFGYDPKVFHLFSLLIHFTATLLVALAIIRVLRKDNDLDRKFGFLLILLFFNAYSLNLVFKLSLDAPIIALVTLFGSVVALQSYAKSQLKTPAWLFISIALFMATIFNYEVAAFLFPVGLLLSWPLINPETKKRNKWLSLLFISGGIASCLLVLLPYQIYIHLQETTGQNIANPALSVMSKSAIKIILQAPSHVFGYLIGIGSGLYPTSSWQLNSLRLLIALPIGGALFLLINRLLKRQQFSLKEVLRVFDNPKAAVCISAAWIFVFASLPYALIGYGSDAIRTYSASIFGILLLCAFTFYLIENRIIKTIGMLIMVGSIIIGLDQYLLMAEKVGQQREFYYQYFLDFTEIIPGVKERTNLIFVNHTVGSLSGCPGMFMMLYQTKEINCGFLSNHDNEYLAERYEGSINAHYGGWSRYENDILIGLDIEGKPVIIQSINSESDLLIIWHDKTPITTDYRKITEEKKYLTSDMYQYLTTHWEN